VNNLKLKRLVFCGIFALLIATLFPPWLYTTHVRNSTTAKKSAGYGCILTPPKPERDEYDKGIELDVSRLMVEWLCIAAATCSAWLAFPLLRRQNAVAPRNVVIADDEEWLCEMYAVALREWFPGVVIQSFQDGAKAWEYLAGHDPDLLIMDLNRTGVDGMETLRRLARLQKTYPIFVASGCMGGLKKEARAAAGPLRVALYQKPFEIDHLKSELFGLLGLEDVRKGES
jgi:CheY-like chemotaxis protein